MNTSFSALNANDFGIDKSPQVQNNSTTNTYWILIQPIGKFENNQVLSFSNSYNSYEEIYLVNNDDSFVKKTIGTNQVYQSNSVLPSFLLNEEIKEVYISVKSQTFLYEYLTIEEEESFNKKNTVYIILMSLSLLILLLLLLFMLIYYWSSKRKIFLYYSFYIISVFFMLFFISNFGRYFLWSKLPFSNSYIEGTTVSFMIATYIWLSATMNGIKTYSKYFYAFFVSLVSIMFVSLLLTIIFQNPICLNLLSNIFSTLGILIILSFSIVGLIRKNANSGLYFIGVLFFFSGAFVRLFLNWGVLSYSILIEFLIVLSIFIELLIFTYVVIRHIGQKVKQGVLNEALVAQYSIKIEGLHLKINKLQLFNRKSIQESPTEISEDINEYLIQPLSKRELEVLVKISNGLKYQKIADELFISINTLKTHVSRIYKKLDAKNRIEAINIALNLSGK